MSPDEDYQLNPFAVTKTSDVLGKSVLEHPGLVWGDYDKEIKRLAVLMTLTESHIELARALCVDALIAHHPIAEGSNSGGVTFQSYLGTYDLAVYELHEAFHGTHPGIPWLHGYLPTDIDISYGGIPGNVVYVGEVLEGLDTLGAIIERLETIVDMPMECKALDTERKCRGIDEINETCVTVRPLIYLGDEYSSVRKVVHAFPHAGFTSDHLKEIKRNHPDIDTLILSISRVYPGDPMLATAEELGLNVFCGTSHAFEIYENGLPLAQAIQNFLPEIEVLIFRERVTATPLEKAGSPELREYAKKMAKEHLMNKPV